jgi:hypothetical protein
MIVSPTAIRGVEAEMEQLRALIREVLNKPYPHTQSDYPYCFFCDKVGRYRDDRWVVNHTPDCWTLRAAAATDEQETTP